MTQQALNRSWYIVIEGAIGVGKTTLARMLSDHLKTKLILEVFEENPFLAKFYESRSLYAFQTQMFFLLSRYRQQQRIPYLLGQAGLISDYMFTKDWLFAQLNLAGDEWDVYQQIHTALAGQIATPDLVVYLQADTDVLMGRIAQRDRPYERTMDRDYLEAVRQAYERYFPGHHEVPTLYIDTNQTNFVTNPADFQSIVERIRSALKEGMFQHPLPHFEAPLKEETLLERGRPLADYQRFLLQTDNLRGLNTDLYFNYLCLHEELGELSRVFTELWREETSLVNKGQPGAEARQTALREHRQEFESKIAGCVTYMFRLSNDAGIDLESAYLEKMRRIQDQT